MGRQDLNVLIGGEAGQGLVTIAMILTKALVRSGYYIVVTQSYQSRIRGGHNTFTIRLSTSEIVASQAEVDFLIALNEETVELHRQELAQDGLILLDERFGDNNNRYLKVPFEQFAEDKFVNVAYLGVLSNLLGLDDQIVFRGFRRLFRRQKTGSHRKQPQDLHQCF